MRDLTVMAFPSNPFWVGTPVPPKKFIGRKGYIDEAFDLIEQRSHLAISGADGMGKTSLLRYLESPQCWELQGYNSQNAIVIYLNCSEIIPFFPTLFWRKIIDCIKEKAPVNSPLMTTVDKELASDNINKESLRNILRVIGKEELFLLALIDEFDVIFRSNENYTVPEQTQFLIEFRNLCVNSDEGRYFPTIITSHKSLTDLGEIILPSGSPWYNYYFFDPLKPFKKAEVDALLAQLPQDWPASLTEGIREISGNHPALLQNACFLLYSLWRSGEKQDIENFTRRFIGSTEYIFKNAWELSGDSEKMLMILLALANLDGRLDQNRRYSIDGIDIIFSQRERDLRELEERGLVKFVQGSKHQYQFSSSVMEWWVIKEIENCKNEEELEQRQKVFSNLSRKQLEQIKSVTKQIWQRKDIIKSLVKYSGEMIRAFTSGVTGNG